MSICAAGQDILIRSVIPFPFSSLVPPPWGLRVAFACTMVQSWCWCLAGICVSAKSARAMYHRAVPYIAQLLLRWSAHMHREQ